MSNSPLDLLDLRSKFAAETGCPLSDIGIAADSSHLTSGGYHCGAVDLKRIDAVGSDDYSIRQPRDRASYNSDLAAGRNLSSAMDFPSAWPRGGRAAWIRWNNLVRAQLGARDPALAAIRGMNFTPDGTMKRRFDCLTGKETSSTDTVTWHTHVEWWRDTIAADQRRWATARIIAMVVAARDGTPLDQAQKAPTSTAGAVTMELVTCTDGSGTEQSVNGATVPKNGRIVITPAGPWSVAGASNFDSTYWKNTLWLTWAEIKDLCSRAGQTDAAAVAAALAADEAFLIAIANAVGASVKDQFGPAFDERVTAAARAAVDARLDDNSST